MLFTNPINVLCGIKNKSWMTRRYIFNAFEIFYYKYFLKCLELHLVFNSFIIILHIKKSCYGLLYCSQFIQLSKSPFVGWLHFVGPGWHEIIKKKIKNVGSGNIIYYNGLLWLDKMIVISSPLVSQNYIASFIICKFF